MLAHSRVPRNPAGFLATASESIKEVDSGKTDLWHGCHKIGEESSKIVPLGAPCSSIPQSHSIQNLLRPFFPSAFAPAICFFARWVGMAGLNCFSAPRDRAGTGMARTQSCGLAGLQLSGETLSPY